MPPGATPPRATCGPPDGDRGAGTGRVGRPGHRPEPADLRRSATSAGCARSTGPRCSWSAAAAGPGPGRPVGERPVRRAGRGRRRPGGRGAGRRPGRADRRLRLRGPGQSPRGSFGAVHAGWRGLVAGVVEAGRRRHAGPRRHRGGRGPRALHPPRVLRVLRPGPRPGGRPATGDGVRGRTSAGRPALDLRRGVGRPGRRRGPAGPRGRRLHRLLRRVLLPPGPGRRRPPGPGGLVGRRGRSPDERPPADPATEPGRPAGSPRCADRIDGVGPRSRRRSGSWRSPRGSGPRRSARPWPPG